MQKFIKALSALDWVVGSLTLLWGLYSRNSWFIAGGALGLVTAYFKPALRVQAALEKRFLRKKPTGDSGKVQAEDAFYADMLGTQPDAQIPSPAVVPDFSRVLASGPVMLSGSSHNVLKPAHLNLAHDDVPPRHWG